MAAMYLEIDSVSLDTADYRITDLRPLWGAAEVRGQDRIIPGAVGTVPYRRRRTATLVALELLIFGDPEAQWTHVAYLRSNVMDPTNTGDGTRPAVLHLPDASTLTGDVHVVGFTFASGGPYHASWALSLSIPGGALT